MSARTVLPGLAIAHGEISSLDLARAVSMCWGGEGSSSFWCHSQRRGECVVVRHVRVLETLRLDKLSGYEVLRCALLVLERRATPIADSRVAQLISNTVQHETGITSTILAFLGISFRHGERAAILNVCPMFIEYGPECCSMETPAPWVLRLERLPYELTVDPTMWLDEYQHTLTGHPRLYQSFEDSDSDSHSD